MKIAVTLISLILTLFFANMFSIYRLGTVPTLLTSFYLIAIFAVFECVLFTISFVIKKILKK